MVVAPEIPLPSSEPNRKSPEYKIENVVVTAHVASSLNLPELKKKLVGAVYEPEKFPALRLKLERIGFLLYSSGKIVCTGAKSPEAARKNVDDLKKALEKNKVKCIKGEVIVQNIVASADLKRSLRLHDISFHMDNCEYNPEYFPGMKIQKDNTRILVFRTGKAIIPGLRDVSEVSKTVSWLNRSLDEVEERIRATTKPGRY